MTRRRRIVLSSLAACHLGLAAAGAVKLCPCDLPVVGLALTYYRVVSGTDSGYAYFAPSVGAPPVARFTVVGRDGRALVDTLETGVTREADIRVEDLIEVMTHRRADDAIRRKVAASWAATMFARHPDAEAVIIDVGNDRIPSMKELRRGEAPRWRSIFRARIARRSSHTRGDTP